MSHACSHSDAITDVPAPHDVCDDCVEIGGTWVHLRQCLSCGRTLCCNDSPNRHMTAHYGATGHPVMRSATPGDAWTWCFADDSMIRATPAGWEAFDPFVEAGTDAATELVRTGGSLDVGEGFVTTDGFPLGEWLAWIREAHRDDALDAGERALVEAVPGWRW